MAIINSIATSIKTTGDWKLATYTATSSDVAETNVLSFTTLTEPTQWCLVGTIASSYFTVTSSTLYVTGACYVKTGEHTREYLSANIANTGSAQKLTRNWAGRIYTEFTQGTGRFRILIDNYNQSDNILFPMKRSSYYFTWYLFYTV